MSAKHSSFSESIQSISLSYSGNPLSIVNVYGTSPNFSNSSGYLSPTYKATPNYKVKKLTRENVSLYYSYNATYKIDLNLIIHMLSPGFEP